MKIRVLLCYFVSAFWLGFILACGSPQRTARGEPHQGAAEDMYQRCWNTVRVAQCGERADLICQGQLADGYYSLDSFAERQQYLMRRGCPPHMVQ